MQNVTVQQGDPWKLADDLAALNEEILIVEKTAASSKFLVVSQAPAIPQTIEVIVGDPDKLSDELNTLIGAGKSIDLVINTFSSAHYVVVYR